MANIPQFTSVDLNDTSTTPTIYDADADAKVYGVFLEHGGSTAEYNLEATDGTDTAVLAQPGAGSNLEFGDTIVVDADTDLQINVTTAEGSTLTATVVVFPGA